MKKIDPIPKKDCKKSMDPPKKPRKPKASRKSPLEKTTKKTPAVVAAALKNFSSDQDSSWGMTKMAIETTIWSRLRPMLPLAQQLTRPRGGEGRWQSPAP